MSIIVTWNKGQQQGVWMIFENLKTLSVLAEICQLCDSIEKRNKKRTKEVVIWSFIRAQLGKSL